MTITYRKFRLKRCKGSTVMDALFFASIERSESRFLRSDKIDTIDLCATVSGLWANADTGEPIFNLSLDCAERAYLYSRGVAGRMDLIKLSEEDLRDAAQQHLDEEMKYREDQRKKGLSRPL